MNKRILWISAVIITVLMALSLDTFAQQGGGGQGRGQGGQAGGQFGALGGGLATPATLLRNEEVVKLLGITTDQTTALNEALRQGQRGAGGAGAAGGGAPAQLTPAERRTRTETQWTEIGKILKAEQLTKFKDIYFQASVPVANPNAPAGAPTPVMSLNVFVLGALNLTADQKEKIVKITDERDAAAAAAGGAGFNQNASQEERAAARTATTERNTKANDAIKALLTADQKKKMDDLTAGAAKVRTDLNLNQPRPGQGGGQGAAGGQGGQRGQGQGGGRQRNN